MANQSSDIYTLDCLQKSRTTVATVNRSIGKTIIEVLYHLLWIATNVYFYGILLLSNWLEQWMAISVVVALHSLIWPWNAVLVEDESSQF